ncbi:Hypothetical protein, predicted transmembrane protein [Mycoplasma yeatsii 13926]|uniref:Uncharacterized protein n=1 Tax=Mycoplasma yeatsii 13926 TaxID=1188240 RepID=S6G8J8_9MOLU|nr:hypothetical protein [Mycoplasma yeatsii]EOA07100.1 Hypothetical protein, predicted transmembrane protein [Mycoplasma yeatsii 13926]
MDKIQKMFLDDNYTDIEKMLECDYYECVNFLLYKYGMAEGDYTKRTLFFDVVSENLNVKRSFYGLEIHHIDEDKVPNLSSKENMTKYPEYQTKDRLVYCNLVEHLLLHIKIYQKTKNRLSMHGVFLIVRKLNTYFSEQEFDDERKCLIYHSIRDLKLDYFKCIDYMEKNRIWKGKQWYLRALDEEIKDQDKLDFYYEELERYIKAGIKPLSVDASINYVEYWKLEKLDALDIYVNKRRRTIVDHYLIEKQFANSYQNKQTNNYSINYQNRSNNVNKKRSSSVKYLLFAALWIILIFMVIILASTL